VAKQTEIQKKANKKYRSSKAKQLRVQYTLKEYALMEAYCKHINSPIGAWIHNLTRNTISADPTFTYTPEDEEESE